MKLRTDNIFQITEVEASPAEVYKALMDEAIHARFTGMKAKIQPKVGGAFSATDGDSSGLILFLEPDKRIVQAWTHVEFEKGFYTTVYIDLETIEKGTRINFNHIGVPEEHSGWLTEGWKKIYWEPLKEFLEEKVLH